MFPKTCLRLMLLLAAVLHLTIARAQWTEIPMPTGMGSSSRLVVHHDKVFSAIFLVNQVYICSTEDYLHWSVVSLLPGGDPYSRVELYSVGERLYFFMRGPASQASRLYVSVNDGVNWSGIPLAGFSPRLFEPMPDALICVKDSVVYRAGLNGADWQPVYDGSERIWSIRALNDADVWFTTPTKLVKSGNAGMDWTEETPPYPVPNDNFPYLTLFPTQLGTFVTVRDGDDDALYFTQNTGASWSITPDLLAAEMISVGNEVWGLFDDGLRVSNDTAVSWQYRILPWGGDQIAASGDTLFCSGPLGFYKSYDDATTWISGNLGWEAAGFIPYDPGIDVMHIHNNRLFALTAAGVFSTGNDGQEWTLHEKYNGLFWHAFSSGDTMAFLGTGVMRTFDNGATWEQFENDDYPLLYDARFDRVGDKLFGAKQADSYCYRSSDWGMTWDTIDPPSLYVENLAGAGDTLYIATQTSDYHILASGNYGLTFPLFENGLANLDYVKSLWGAGPYMFADVSGDLYRRSGNGWALAENGLPNDPELVYNINNIVGDERLTVLYKSLLEPALPEIYYSVDGGSSWLGNLGEGLPAMENEVLVADSNAIYLYGKEGYRQESLWKTTVELPVISITNAPRQPLALEIAPNPASTDIRFSIAGSSTSVEHVEVFDALGRLHLQKDVSGTGQTTLVVSSLTDGVYILVVGLEDGRRATRRFLVQR